MKAARLPFIATATALVALCAWTSGAQAQVKLRYAHVGVANAPQTLYADEVAKLVKERTGGRVEIQVFANSQLGGVGPQIAQLVKDKLGYKQHWAVPDYLQRSARHLASKTDADQAWAVGEKAVEYALAGRNAVMPVIKRVKDAPYRWKIEPANLEDVANHEKKMPRDFITKDGYGITDKCRRYLEPLVRGEDAPPYGKDGLPVYVKLKNTAVAKKLPVYKIADK